MRWMSKWWGIILVAENENDKTLLMNLQQRLPKEPKPSETYEGGKLKIDTDNEENEFRLVFNR